MSSSTSSSKNGIELNAELNTTAELGADGAPNPRVIYLKTLLVILLGMGISLGAVRIFTYMNDASAESFLGRVLEARAALPQITQEQDDLVMFFGSSMVRAGFSARQFDRELAEQGVDVKSFNFGFGGLNPLFQDYLSRRIADRFVQDDRRLKLALIEFNPFQTTVTRRNRAREAEDSFISILASSEELLQIGLKDPATAVRMANIRYLRDGVSAEMITNFFSRPFQAPRPRTELIEDEQQAARLDELGDVLNERFEQDYPDFDGANWSYEWQGAGTIPEERSADTLAVFEEYYGLLASDYQMDNDRLSRIHTADIIELNFDQELVDSFIQIVKNFQRISDHVEVVLLPKNTKWIQNPPEALARQQEVVDRIAAETGVNISDFQTIDEIKPEMFSDTTHLARYLGDVPFTSFLVEQYVERLQ